MRKILFFTLFLIFYNCAAQRDKKNLKDTTSKFSWMATKDTSIIGKAFNAKAGAVIVDIYERTYYIDGLESWDEKYEGQMLKVKGRLANKTYPGGELPADPNKPLVQSMEGDMTIITNATWSIVKTKARKRKEKTRSKG